MIVPVPCRSGLRLDFQNGVDDPERIEDDGIIPRADTVADQFEKYTVDHVARGKRIRFPGSAIGNAQGARFFVLCGVLLTRDLRLNAHVVRALAERSGGCDGPLFEMALQIVAVILNEPGGGRIAAMPEEG